MCFWCQGEALKSASIHRSVVAESLQWHPDKKIIAIGWQSGEITTYSDTDHEIFEQSSIHRAAIGFLQWNKAGSRLISGDKVRWHPTNHETIMIMNVNFVALVLLFVDGIVRFIPLSFHWCVLIFLFHGSWLIVYLFAYLECDELSSILWNWLCII